MLTFLLLTWFACSTALFVRAHRDRQLAHRLLDELVSEDARAHKLKFWNSRALTPENRHD
jgi:hypothetical protein